MPTYTYPVGRPEGTLSTEQIHLLLQNPNVIARRLQALTDQRFVADYLLAGRFEAVGGGVFYETGEEIFAADEAERVAPGGEYPLTIMSRGELAAAKTEKWGLDTEIYDEAISRLGINTVDRALARLANTVIKDVDSVAGAVVASKITDTTAAAGAWSDVANIVRTLLRAQAKFEGYSLGLVPDTIALSGFQYAEVIGTFITAGVLPREQANVFLTGNLPVDLLGYTWVTSPHLQVTDPLLIDRDQLGGMADENLGSPGYVRAGGVGVETKVERLSGSDDRDGYRPRARRVTVPVVLEPAAGTRITGTGLPTA